MFIDWTTLTSLIINIVAAVSFFVLGIISKTIFNFIRNKNPARNFWGLCVNSANIIVPSLPTNHNEFSLHTGHSDLKASAEIASLLSFFGIKSEKLRMLEVRYALDRLEDNIVLIGGPETNEITREIMQNFRIPFSFSNHILIDTYHNIKYKPKLDEEKNVLEDYAFILKMKNPYNNQKTIIIISGCFGYGTYAGAVAVTDYKILRTISKKIKKSKVKSIGIIVKSHIINKIPQRPFIVEIFEISK